MTNNLVKCRFSVSPVVVSADELIKMGFQLRVLNSCHRLEGRGLICRIQIYGKEVISDTSGHCEGHFHAVQVDLGLQIINLFVNV